MTDALIAGALAHGVRGSSMQAWDELTRGQLDALASYAVSLESGDMLPEKEIRPGKKKDAPFHLALSASLAELLDEGGKTDHRFRQLLYDFSTLGASLEVARAYLASQLGISPPQYNIAMIVANHQNTGGISVTDVAKRLHVSTAFITLEAGSLEQAGLIEKKPNPKDRRGIFLQPLAI